MSWPGRRAAIALWVALAVVVWNAIFDRVLILAGRRYVSVAEAAVRAARPYERVNDWMSPAIGRAAWLASAGTAIVLVIGIVALAVSGRRKRG